MKIVYFLILTAGLFLVGCSKEEPAPLPPLKPVDLPTNVAGLYSGKLPCDKCKARMIRVTLAEDSSVVATETLISDSIKVDSLKGSYSIAGEKLSLVFAERNIRWNFKRGDASGNMVLLAGDGGVYTNADGETFDLIRIFTSPKSKESLADSASVDSSKTDGAN